MKNLFKILPPFAPDYSGVCSVLFSLNGMVVVHDAGGCTGNITGYDEPRWYGSNAAIFSSGLREIEAVLGDDEKLIDRIIRAAESLQRRFIALLGSPAPAVIGTDLEALACILEKRSGLPVLSFNTTGMDYYDRGASNAYLQIARRFVEPYTGEKQSVVNILGATPLDIGQVSMVESMVAILLECGIQRVLVWGQNAGLPEIRQAGSAVLNLVVANSGLQAARYMEKEFNIPYRTGIPIGHGSTREFKYQVSSVFGWNMTEDTRPSVKIQNQIRRALVIGEQIRANSLRQFLRMDLGIADVDIASYFSMDEELREKNDCFLIEEDELTILCRVGDYQLVIGDPLYEHLLEYNPGRIFVPLSHVAVSSHLYWNMEADYIGAGALEMLSRIPGLKG